MKHLQSMPRCQQSRYKVLGVNFISMADPFRAAPTGPSHGSKALLWQGPLVNFYHSRADSADRAPREGNIFTATRRHSGGSPRYVP